MHSVDLVCLETHIALKPPVYGVKNDANKKEFAKEFVNSQQNSKEWDSSFYLADLGQVVRNLQLWTKHMPKIRPYYAMKCNPSQPVVQLLASLGVGFDCASKFEIETALKCGVKPEDILFAVPCKMSSHIEYACQTGVQVMTVDNADELHKIKRIHPTGKLLLRLNVKYCGNGIKMGDKFGVTMSEARELILLCKELELDLIGVCFHPGSGSNSFETIRDSLQRCRELYDFAKLIGNDFKIVDIGGGFVCGDNFIKISKQVNATIDRLFPPETGLTVIAEPGRFFVENAFAFVTSVHGKAIRGDSAKYYIGSGVFAAFCLKYFEKFIRIPESLSRQADKCKCYASTVYGPTGAGDDIVLCDSMLPEAQIDDWWLFDNMGAYSPLLSLGFNGYMVTKAGFFISQDTWNEIADKLNPNSPLFEQYQQLEKTDEEIISNDM
uniref:ornithine decarboxylase 1-like isoform X1 n=1 Tax=Ciona intestinalis TaxID=7719 RepID=UPI000180CA57|nr:ornithine decarboxylase 1-like isoform X1 [Ciona intestinalis]|eukprot:XP_002123875.1 ornithine decarboxylase 1-like isoform X1 [Ciona intestinalis]